MYKGECEKQIDSVDGLRGRSFRIVVKSAKYLVLLIGEDLLTTLAAGHTILLLLSSFGGGKLLGFLGAFDFVALHKVSDCRSPVGRMTPTIASNFSSSSSSLLLVCC